MIETHQELERYTHWELAGRQSTQATLWWGNQFLTITGWKMLSTFESDGKRTRRISKLSRLDDMEHRLGVGRDGHTGGDNSGLVWWRRSIWITSKGAKLLPYLVELTLS